MTSKLSLTGVCLALAIAFPNVYAQNRKVSQEWITAAVTGGTGVGNGSLSRQNYSEPGDRNLALQRHFQMERSVQRVGQSLRHQFRESRNTAFDAYIYQSPDQAFCVLRKAMQDAASSMSNGPMTKILLDRGVNLAAAINSGSDAANCANPTNQATLVRKTRAAVLFDWVELVIDVAEDFDLPYYLPYRNLYHRCNPSPNSCDEYDEQMPPRYRDFDYRQFELQLVKLAARQLNLINNGFSLEGPHGAVPFGSLNVYINVVENLSAMVTLDLLNNLYRYAYNSATVQLHSLAWYLSQSSPRHQRGMDVFRFAHAELSSVANKLESDQFIRWDEDHDRTSDWVTPDLDRTWVAPRRPPSKNVPGFFDQNNDGQWVQPRR